MMTRFYDRANDRDGPVSGAFCPIVVPLAGLPAAGAANNGVYNAVVQLPTGAKYQVTHVTVFCGTVTSDPTLAVGTSLAGTQIVNTVNLVVGANQLTVKSYAAAATGQIHVVMTADANDAAADPVGVTLWGYMSAPPTSMLDRNY